MKIWHTSARSPFLQAMSVAILAFLFINNEGALALVLENKALFLTSFGILVAGPLWVAYGRLNNLDSTEGLKTSQARIVGDFAVSAKKLLLQYFAGSVLFVTTVFVAWLLGETFPAFRLYFLGFSVATLAVFLVVIIYRIAETLLRVEKTLQSVANWRLEQRERSKQIEGLKKARSESKFVPDEKLLNYRKLGFETNSSESEKVSGATPDLESERVSEEKTSGIAPDLE